MYGRIECSLLMVKNRVNRNKQFLNSSGEVCLCCGCNE